MIRETGRVEIVISEPWPGVEKCIGFAGKRASYTCKYYGNTVHCVLIRLDTPFVFDDVECAFLVCSPRHVGFEIDDIWTDRTVAFGMMQINESKAESVDWFDTSAWRGGSPVFVGSLNAL